MNQSGILLVGITGGIGSGKSTVAKLLAQSGYPIVDADALSRQLTQPGGPAMPKIAQAFGKALVAPDGGLHRQRMRELAFSQQEVRQKLEAILHPLIGQSIANAIAEHVQTGAPCVLLDIPLITSASRWPPMLDRILVVDCRESTQIDRVRLRSQLTEAEVKAIMAQQISRLERRALADWVIFNDDLSIEELKRQVLELPLPRLQ
jgi:dephospho-CoA kinase